MQEIGKYPIPPDLPEGSYIIYPEKGGMLIKGPDGKNLKGTVVPGSIRNSEDAIALSRRRSEVLAMKTRKRITEEANKLVADGKLVLPQGVKNATDVFAEAAAMMFTEIVMNPKSHARDRLAVFDRLGKVAEVLKDPEEKEEKPVIPNSMLSNASKILLAIEYAKENPEIDTVQTIDVTPNIDVSALRIAEDVEPKEKKWI